MFTPMRKLAALFLLPALFFALRITSGFPAQIWTQPGEAYLASGFLRQAQDGILRQAQNRVYQEGQNSDADTNDSYDVFYDQLSSAGHWIFAENYGYVFQPLIAASNADWRPYTNGHWESTDRGWYWDTDEPFGWATYHYGRWANIVGTGWVWTPGTEWSPAWVSWRVCDNGYVGWAPLPPECPRATEAVPISGWCDAYSDTGPGAFSFLPISAWFNQSYVGFFAPISQNVELINASRNVTNISANKGFISNFGPEIDLITQGTGQQVKPYTLHYSAVPGRNRFGRLIGGSALNINGPAAKLKANATKVPTVIKTVVKPAVNKGWIGLTKEEVDGLHSKYAAEAHIPRKLPSKSTEGVSLISGEQRGGISLLGDQKAKAPKESKENEKGATENGAKGKIGSASEHKDSNRSKKVAESKREGGSKGEGKSKGTKAAKGSKGSDRGKSSKKKTSSSKSGSKGGSASKRGSKDTESKRSSEE